MFKSKCLKISYYIHVSTIIFKRMEIRWSWENMKEKKVSKNSGRKQLVCVCVCGNKSFPGWCRYTAVLIYLGALGCLTGTQQKPQTALSLHTDPPTIHSLCMGMFISAFGVERIVGASSAWIVSCMTVVWKLVNCDCFCVCAAWFRYVCEEWLDILWLDLQMKGIRKLKN